MSRTIPCIGPEIHEASLLSSPAYCPAAVPKQPREVAAEDLLDPSGRPADQSDAAEALALVALGDVVSGEEGTSPG